MKKSGGYTLLELLAVLALTGMVAAALGGLLLSGQRACQRVDDYSEIQENARIGLEMMTRDIKGCRGIVQVDPSSLQLLDSDGSALTYQVASQTLYRTAKGTKNPVCNQVTDLALSRRPPDLLEISLTTGEAGFSYELTTRVSKMTD